MVIRPQWLVKSVNSSCLLCKKNGYYALSVLGLNEQEMIRSWKRRALHRKAKLFLVIKPPCEKVQWPSNIEERRFVFADADVT